MAIVYRSRTEIAGIHRACRVVMETLALLRAEVRPGVTTAHLDALAARALKERGATSNFKKYRPAPDLPPYPATICASVNAEIVHGVPGPRALREGDIVSLDMGAIVDGWHGDSAITVGVGAISPEAQRLLDVTEEALRRGIAAAQPGARVSAISEAIQTYVEGAGCSIVRDLEGHGIGRKLHEDPSIPNYVDRRGPDPLLRVGMVFCIEPMVSAGRPQTRTLRDQWTIVTADGSLAAHFEHALAITPDGSEILTRA